MAAPLRFFWSLLVIVLLCCPTVVHGQVLPKEDLIDKMFSWKNHPHPAYFKSHDEAWDFGDGSGPKWLPDYEHKRLDMYCNCKTHRGFGPEGPCWKFRVKAIGEVCFFSSDFLLPKQDYTVIRCLLDLATKNAHTCISQEGSICEKPNSAIGNIYKPWHGQMLHPFHGPHVGKLKEDSSYRLRTLFRYIENHYAKNFSVSLGQDMDVIPLDDDDKPIVAHRIFIRGTGAHDC